MSLNDKREFKFARKVTLKDFEAGTPIYSADYTFIQEGADGAIYQCDLVEESETKKTITFEMKPGIFKLEQTQMGIVASKIETQKVEFLETSQAYQDIIFQIDSFFKNLHVYKKLGIEQPRRGALLYSHPGAGKTSTLSRVSDHYSNNRNTCVLIWPSDGVEANHLESFLIHNTDWSGVERLILVLEDIGGGNIEYGRSQNAVPASLLNFLDGISNVFFKPTFIVATTNNPDALLDSLTSRPGRFDSVIEIKTPNAKDRIAFLKFFAKDDYNLTEEEEKKIASLTEHFSIAHLKEVYFRAMILERTMLETALELKKHREKVKKGLVSKETGGSGFGFGMDD